METPRRNRVIRDEINLSKSNKLVDLFNKITGKGSELLGKVLGNSSEKELIPQQLQTPPVQTPPVQTQQLQNIDSLVVVLPSCHGNTSSNTYLENYKLFVNEQTSKGYSDFIIILKSSLDSTDTAQISYLEQQTYIAIPDQTFKLIFHEDHSDFISTVSQGTCSLATTNKRVNFIKEQSSEAKALTIINQQTKYMEMEIKNKGINLDIIHNYSENLKQTLRNEETSRYKILLFEVYQNNILEIIEDLKFILKIFTFLESKHNSVMRMYTLNKTVLTNILSYFNNLNDLINNAISNPKAQDDIPKIPQITLQQKVIINDLITNIDIECLKETLNIINIILSNPVLKTEIDSDPEIQDDFKTIMDLYTTYIKNWNVHNIPLYLTYEDSTIDNYLFIYEEILNDALWRSEVVDPEITQDIDMQLTPYFDDKEDYSTFDCQYGINIMSAVKCQDSTCFSLKDGVPELARKQTRQSFGEIKPFLKKNKLSGQNLYIDNTWRTLSIVNFFSSLLNMFLENTNVISRPNKDKAKKIIKLYLVKYIENFTNKLDETEKKFNIKKQKLDQIDLERMEKRKPLIAIEEYQLSLTKNKKDILIQVNEKIEEVSVSDINLSNDELSRVCDFVKIFTTIIYKEDITMSLLRYYFQYLLNFTYGIYILPSCRVIHDLSMQCITPQRKGGYLKSKRRNLKKKTYKKKINKRKSLKRKTLKRKTLKKKRLY